MLHLASGSNFFFGQAYILCEVSAQIAHAPFGSLSSGMRLGHSRLRWPRSPQMKQKTFASSSAAVGKPSFPAFGQSALRWPFSRQMAHVKPRLMPSEGFSGALAFASAGAESFELPFGSAGASTSGAGPRSSPPSRETASSSFAASPIAASSAAGGAAASGAASASGAGAESSSPPAELSSASWYRSTSAALRPEVSSPRSSRALRSCATVMEDAAGIVANLSWSQRAREGVQG